MIQPSSFHSAASVDGGSVLPSLSWPSLPIGSGCQSMARPARDAAAFITLTVSGTTSRPMSSPSKIPIFKQASPGRRRAARNWPTITARHGRTLGTAFFAPAAQAAIRPQWSPCTLRTPARTDVRNRGHAVTASRIPRLIRHKAAVDRERLAGDRGEAPGLARKTTAAATSSGVMKRPMGMRATMRARVCVVVHLRARRREHGRRRHRIDADIMRRSIRSPASASSGSARLW